MTKTPGFRTLFRSDLRDWRDAIVDLRSVWDASLPTQYDTAAPGNWRKRTTAELPENSPRQLRLAAKVLRVLAQQMTDAAGVLDDRADGYELAEPQR
jgi:hypothetical protein